MITIQKPWYGAGSEKWFGWVKDNFRLTGIGLDERMFANMNNEPVELYIQSEKKTYLLNMREAYELSKKYNAVYYANGLKLIVFPKDILLLKN